jgi:hypothetical protein
MSQRANEPAAFTAQKLRDLASWYREYAEHTGNVTIWESRLRTAEDLEAEAAKLEAMQKKIGELS